MFGLVCPSVCLSVCVCVCPVLDLSFESLDLETSFLYAGAVSEYLVQFHMSRSSGFLKFKVTGAKNGIYERN